jgi:peptidoglycan/LPS O-acetylase OafA/YrhL
MKRYFNSLNFLRGVAALAVCFYHFACGNVDYLKDTNIIKIMSQYGHWGVEVFFVISGFIIPYSMYIKGYTIKNWKEFLIKRTIRIEPPYLLNILLVIVLAYMSTLSPYYRGDKFSLDYLNLISHLGYLNSYFGLPPLNPVFWTLVIEFQYYILISLILPFVTSSNKYIRYTTLLAFYGTGYFLWDKNFIFRYSLIFITGIMIFLFFSEIIKRKEFYINIIVVFFLISITYETTVLIPTAFAFLIILFTDINFTFSNFLGKISYSVYLIHVPIGARVLNLSENFIIGESLRTIFIFIAIGISIVAGWVFFYIIERPALKWSSKIIYNKKKLKESMV